MITVSLEFPEQETNEKEVNRAATDATMETVLLIFFVILVVLAVGHLVSSLVDSVVYNINLILFKT